MATPEQLAELAEMGVHRLIVAPPTSNPEAVREAVLALGERIAPYL